MKLPFNWGHLIPLSSLYESQSGQNANLSLSLFHFMLLKGSLELLERSLCFLNVA